MLIGAYVLSLQEPNAGASRFWAIFFALLVGTFGGLGYTAAEVYLDYCAEWMATIQPYTLTPVTTTADGDAPSEEDDDNKDKNKLQAAAKMGSSTTKRDAHCAH
jgi:hypothetical protein